MDHLTTFQRYLLYVIAARDGPHGLANKDELETDYESERHHGRLYPNLDTVVDEGLVEKGQVEERTNYFRVTEAGQELIATRREWEQRFLESIDSLTV